VPVYNSKDLFAKLILDGAQAGLAWITILRKRGAYYKAFDGLDPEKMARYSDQKIEKILLDPGIVRNRLKVQSAVKNAKAYVAMQKQGVNFSEFLWSFVGDKTKQNKWRTSKQMPAVTEEAEAMLASIEKVPRNVIPLVRLNAALGHDEAVFEWLEVARDVKLPWYPWMITWFPDMAQYRSDPRLRDLAAEIGLLHVLESPPRR